MKIYQNKNIFWGLLLLFTTIHTMEKEIREIHEIEVVTVSPKPKGLNISTKGMGFSAGLNFSNAATESGSASNTPRAIIDSPQGLKDYVKAKSLRRGEERIVIEEVPNFTPGYMATLFNSLIYKNDEKKLYELAALTQELDTLKKTEPKKFQAFCSYIVKKAEINDGEVSAKALQEKKLNDRRKKSSTSSNADYEPITFRELELTKRHMSDTERELYGFLTEAEKIKSEMRKLAHTATQETIAKKESDASRNAWLALAGVVVTAIIGPVITTYASKSTSTSSGCTPPPTSPLPAPPF